jgi:hypothetical protein
MLTVEVAAGGVERDIPRLWRCSPLFLNRRVQGGSRNGASGFPLKADMHTGCRMATPGYALGSRKYPGRCREPQGMSWGRGYTDLSGASTPDASEAAGSESSSALSDSTTSKAARAGGAGLSGSAITRATAGLLLR